MKQSCSLPLTQSTYKIKLYKRNLMKRTGDIINLTFKINVVEQYFYNFLYQIIAFPLTPWELSKKLATEWKQCEQRTYTEKDSRRRYIKKMLATWQGKTCLSVFFFLSHLYLSFGGRRKGNKLVKVTCRVEQERIWSPFFNLPIVLPHKAKVKPRETRG